MHAALDVLRDYLSFALDLMTNKQSEFNPSFAAMSTSIDQAIEQAGDEDDNAGDLKDFFSSFAWLTVKNVTTTLEVLADMLMTAPGYLKLDVVVEISNIIHSVLSRIRHRGVMEWCADILKRLSSSFSKSKHRVLADLPSTWLDQCFDHIKQCISVTRRGAGLPYLVRAVTSSDPKVCDNTARRESTNFVVKGLATQFAKKLLEIVNMPLTDFDETTDPPQVINRLWSQSAIIFL
jgi:hypothetical protein